MVFNVAPNILMNSNIYLSQIVTREREDMGYRITFMIADILVSFHMDYYLFIYLFI